MIKIAQDGENTNLEDMATCVTKHLCGKKKES